MALATGGFSVNRVTVSQILQLLPDKPELLRESFFKTQEFGHPLRIGWNKIEFHRDFCRYAGLISGKGAGDYVLTKLGEVMAHNDLNLSNLNSWWFIHTQLALNLESNVYYALFAHLPMRPLTREEIKQEMTKILASKVSKVTIEKDVDAILGWYNQPPFAHLGTLVTDDKNWKRSNTNLPDCFVVAYALYVFRELKHMVSSMQFSSLYNSNGAVGTVLGLEEKIMKVRLRQAQASIGTNFVSFSETAGMDTVYLGNFQTWEIAEQYYQNLKQPKVAS
jgi:hypothetical protein